MKKRILLSLLCGMLCVGGVFGVSQPSWAQAEQSLTLPDGLFAGSSSFELRYESGSLDPESLTGSALGVQFYEAGKSIGDADKVSIVTTGTLTGGDLVVEELMIDGLVWGDKDSGRLAVDRLKLVSSGTWDGGDLVIEKLEVDGFDSKSDSEEVSVRTMVMKTLSIAELVAAGEKVSNVAMLFKDLDPKAIQRGDMGPLDQENIMALFGAIKDVAGLLDGFSLTLKDIQWMDDVQSGSLGKVVLDIRDGFWLPEFSIERVNIADAGGEIDLQLETVRFELAGSFSSRLSALFEIVGLGLRPNITASQAVQAFFETLDREEVVVDFGTQFISTVGEAEYLSEVNFAFAVSELMGLKFEFATRSPTNPIAFLGSSKFFELTQEERQTALEKIGTQGQLDHAQLTLTNWNAIDTFLNKYALITGQSEEQLRMTGEMMINMFVGRGTPTLAEASDALVAFLKTPGTLQASFRPPKPLPAPDTPELNALVANPGALADALGLSVKFFDEPMSIESHRLTQVEGAGSKQVGISTNGMPKALPPIPDSNVADWLSARRAYADEDYETVLRLMVTHAEAGTESAQRVVAHSYRKTDQFEQAAAWYEGLAEKGDAASQFYLGMLYQKGLGVEQDNQVALEWLEKAAAQGDARAIYALALSTQTIEVVKEINPGLSARAQEVLTDVVRHYYEADDPSGIHFSGKSDVLIPTALWDLVIVRWRTEGVMPSHVILQAVAGEDVEKLTSQVATPEPQGCDEGTPSGVDSANDRRCLQERKDPDRRWSSPASCIACDLSNIDLVGADLSGASLLNANLSGANLTSANLTSANLTNANLTNAKLSNANLKQAYINGADLASADLTGANLTYAVISRRTQTDGAIFCNTIMMEGTTNNVDCPCPSDDSSCPSDTATLFGIGEYEKLVYWGEVSAVPPGFEHPLATKAGIPHGQGTLSTPEGTLVGEFRHGEPWEVTGYEKDEDSVLTPKGQKGKVLGTVSEGRMIETFKWYGPGDNIGDCIYKGQTNNRQQQPHGQGTITCYDGAKFVGEWKVGEMWEGVETFPAKYMPGVCPCTTDMSGGTNQNGNPVNAKMVDKDGDTLVTWTEGKCKGSDEYCPEVFR